MFKLPILLFLYLFANGASVFGQQSNAIKKEYHAEELRFNFHRKALAMEDKNDIRFLSFVNEELKYSKRMKDNELVLDSYAFSIGYLIRKRNFAKAIEYANNALFYFDQEKQPEFKARIYGFLGSICMQRKEYTAAIAYGKKAIIHSKKMAGTVQMSYFMSNLGLAYLKQGNYKMAIYYLDRALKQIKPMFSKSLDYKNLEIVTLTNLANCKLEIGDISAAELLLTTAKQRLNNFEQSKPLLTRVYLCESILYQKKGEIHKAIQSAKKGLAVAAKLPNYKVELFDVLNTLYALNGNYKQAYLSGQVRVRYVDSLNQSELNEISKVIALNMVLANNGKKNALNALKMTHDLETKRTQNGLLILLVIGGFTSLFLLKRNALSKQKQAKISAERLNLEKRNIELELESRNKEVSFFTMKQAHMDEFILSVKTELEKNKTLFKDDQLNYINGIVRKIKSKTSSANWNEFEIRFQQVHTQFYTRLFEMFPTLTANERRICSFIKLGMSSKEMASLTGQTVNSIGVARIRLRKKLGITNEDVRIEEVLNQLSSSTEGPNIT